ncbi:phage tail sheath C-terminal domain-containing protein [Streptomyces sp. NPDC007940]|uniref:phage tail sheath family protein n=1 Tax=Streptomyces sp. NPDC007940 TaxID=3364796 RepID=UPI0036E1C9F7
MTTPGLHLGAPGLYRVAERPDRSPVPVRLDVAGFVGVTPRGPVDEPVPVRSWSDYRLRFGGFEGPGLLPYAVSAFFAQGGERAYVLRVGPRVPGPDDGRARHRLELMSEGRPTTVGVAARDWGTWGDLLTVRLEFEATQPFRSEADADGLALPAGTDVPRGTLLRLRGADLQPAGEFRWVTSRAERPAPGGGRRRVAVLDRALPGTAVRCEVVTAALVVDDGDPDGPRRERITALGLHPDHPRFLGTTVREESQLVSCDAPALPLTPSGPLLPAVTAERIRDGRDRYGELTGDAFFDERLDVPPAADPLDDREHHGADLLARTPELGLLCVPDLLWSWDVPGPASDPWADLSTDPCTATAPIRYRRRDPEMRVLDARDPEGLTTITARQLRLVALAELHRRFTVLLDVPPGLDTRAVARWRAGFDSAFAAAYHPWLAVMGESGVRAPVPASAFAAGIVAARERRLGLSWGPANELARGAVLGAARVGDAEHDTLFAQGINVYRAERDGFRLTSAHTLSSDPAYRHLGVRRLMTMLRLALDRQSQWVVFEPHTPGLRERLRHTLELFLLRLHRAGAFAGATPDEAFFVRTGDDLNPPVSQGLGRLVAEIGVAPVAPLEFLVLRVCADGEAVRVEEDGDGGS